MSKKEDEQNISPFARYKKERRIKKKIANVCSAIVLVASFLFGLAFVVEHAGKGNALLYIFLLIWAMAQALSND